MRLTYFSYALIALISGVVARNIDTTQKNDSLSIGSIQASNATTTPVPAVATNATSAIVTKLSSTTTETTPSQETTTAVTTSTTANQTVPVSSATTVVTSTEKATTSVSQKTPVTVATTTKGVTTTPYPAISVISQERHFDGLSFMGGIILTVCLVGIGVFSLKFYRTCSEGNYRTL